MYQHFARVYDAFMKDTAAYKQWAGYIKDVFDSCAVPQNGLVLDLACGTGTMAFLMAQKGYDLIGIDASADMLSEARSKENTFQKNFTPVLFLNQDILELNLYGTVDAAYSTCDAFNYILTEENFAKALKNLALYLNPGGVFVFDLKTDYKYRYLGDNTYNDSSEHASYIWKNHYNTETCINEYQVQFFFEGEGSFIETHYQRAYTPESVTKLAAEAGLRVVSIKDNYSQKPAQPESERLTYTIST